MIYHDPKGELGIDYHEEEYYDVIKAYQEIYGKSFIEAVRALAQVAGVKLVFSKEEKKRIEKEQALAEFDPYAYITDELKIRGIIRYRRDGEYFFDFSVENREGEVVPLSVPLFKLLDYKYALKLFGAHTGYKPDPLPERAKEEAWERVIDAFFETYEKAEDFDRSEAQWEAEELIKIIKEGPATDNVEDFLHSKSRYVKFYDEGRVYAI